MSKHKRFNVTKGLMNKLDTGRPLKLSDNQIKGITIFQDKRLQISRNKRRFKREYDERSKKGLNW